MARITTEDCLDKINNRFELVMLAAKRARLLSKDGVEPLLNAGNEKATITALREIASGKVNEEYLKKFDIDYSEDILKPFTFSNLGRLGASSLLRPSSESDDEPNKQNQSIENKFHALVKNDTTEEKKESTGDRPVGDDSSR